MRLNTPKPRTVTLERLLQRRGLTLEAWARSAGVSSYPEVVRWCDRVGAVPPQEEVWLQYMPVPVNAPSDGIVVIDAVEQPASRRSKKSASTAG